MPTPPKPVKVIEMEGKSHRTKKELAQRKRAEEELLTGIRMEEKPESRLHQVLTHPTAQSRTDFLLP